MNTFRPQITIKLVLLLFVLLVAIRTIAIHPLSSDSWVHLGVGRFITQFRQIPTHSDISFKVVAPGTEWLSHSWLSDFVFYLGFGKSSLAGVIFVLFPTFLLSMYVLTQLLSSIKTSTQAKATAVGLAGVLSLSFWSAHPFVFAIPLSLFILQAYIEQKTNRWKSILTLIVYFLFAQMAGGYVFVLGALFVCFVVTQTIAKFLLKSSIPLNTIALHAAGLLLTLLNPAGYKIWTYAGTIVNLTGSFREYISLAGALTAANSNYIREHPSTLFYVLFLIYVLTLIVAILFFSFREKHSFFTRQIVLSIIGLPALYLAYRWVRFIPFATFLTIPLFALVLTHWEESVHKSVIKKGFYTGVSLISILLLSYLFVWPQTSLHLPPPERQLDFILEKNLPLRVLPTFEITSYTYYKLFPEKGFIDAQDDLFDENDLVNVYFLASTLPEGFIENVVSSYEINTIIATKDTEVLTSYLASNENWTLVFLERNGLVFVNNHAVPNNFLENYGLNHLDLGRNLGFDPEYIAEATSELERFVAENPNTVLATGQLATLYRLQGRLSDAESTLQKIPKESWDYVVSTEMGRIMAAQGQCRSSEQYFMEALSDRQEQNFSRTVLDLAVLYAACFRDKKAARHYFERYNSYALPQTEREKVKQIARDFGVVLDDTGGSKDD